MRRRRRRKSHNLRCPYRKIGDGKVFPRVSLKPSESELMKRATKPSNQSIPERKDLMKKLFPILTILLALFAGPLIGQDAEQPTDAPNAEESAKTDDEEAPVDSESTDATKTEGEEEGESEEAPAVIDSGDTAWMIVATALVLMMTIPGLSLFYGGLARRKNVLSVLVQCFACTALMTLLWTIYGTAWPLWRWPILR